LFFNLQLLRAFAALNVVLFHIIGTAASYGYETNLISFLEGWGANGVDIFFVISGFIMLHTQLNNKRTIKDFLILRAIRIIPIYWLLTLSVIVINIIAPSAFRDMVISTEWALASLGFMSNVVGENFPIIHVGWTLEWEILFYLVFGISLWFRSWVVVLLLTFIVLIGISLSVSNFILFEFLAGLLIALFYNFFGFNRFGKVSLVLGGLLLSLSLLEQVRTLVENHVIFWGLPSIFLVYGVVTTPQVNTKIGRLLGDASYSIYLIQIFSIPVFYKLIVFLDFDFSSDFLAIICLLTTAICGTVMYIFIEKPITYLIKTLVYSK